MQFITSQKQAFLSTLLHVVELAVILAAVYGVAWFFDLQQEPAVKDIAILTIAALAKFVRTSDVCDIHDYVNKPKSDNQ